MTASAALLVLHAPGDPAGGTLWRDAFVTAGWSGEVYAPDLPGHGSTPAPPGGSYENGDAILSITPWLSATRERDAPVVVVGVGANGWAAQLIGLAGRATGVVLVDGLGGPWRSPTAMVHRWRDWLRDIADDPAAVAPPPAGGLDPRVAHGVPGHGSERLARKAASEMPVPAWVVESPASALTSDEVADIVSSFAAGAGVVRAPGRHPSTVAPLVLETFARR